MVISSFTFISYIYITRGNAKKLTEDVKEFNRKLRLIEYFNGTEDEDI